jgi:protein-disulfide isomerase
MSIFSARFRPLAKEAFGCVFKTITFRPCDTGADDKLKAEVVSGLLKVSPGAARLVNRHFVTMSWVFVVLTLVSFAYTAAGVYNFYYYGNCDGPQSPQACILNDLTGDYGRFSDPKDLIAPTELDGITAGDPDADIVIVEFGCFTCPYTAQAESSVMMLLRRHNDSVYYVFKPFPLPNHAYSYETAKAVLCAEEQGMHWELKNKIFAQQMVCIDEGEVAIDSLAEEAGLDMEAFNACYQGSEVEEELERYIDQGKASHLYATPTFFINGKPLVGPQTLAGFEAAITEAGNETQ